MPALSWGSTSSMAIDRRRFLAGALVALAAPRAVLAAEARAAGHAETGAVYAAAARRQGSGYAVLLVTGDGHILREIPLTARAHDIAVDRARRRAVACARRPGYFALAFDLDGRAEPEVFAPPQDRHFYGHGAFAPDGRLIYMTEHDVETGEGVIGVYDATGGFRRVGEFPSYGIGPHEAILLADGRTLVAANGGFGSDPATGRESIDVAGMEPNMAFIDVTTGALETRHGLPPEINLLSIRHLAADAGGAVWFGGQWQGAIEDAPELIGSARIDRPIALVGAGGAAGAALRGYIGSVAVCAEGRLLAASAPRAGCVVYADTETGRIVHEVALKDACGLAGSGPRAFAISSGHGVVRIEGEDKAGVLETHFASTEFDNHLRRV